MKKKLAIALAAAFPLFATAQSNITIYGIVDAAVAVENSGVDGYQTVLNSGNQSSSRVGFRGTEVLGYGLKALFNLEAGTFLDTGASDVAGLFQRRAVVGVESDFGTLTLGREYSPIASIAASSDTFGQGFYGNNLSAFNPGRLTRRLSNSFNYKSPPFYGVKALAAWSAGERTGDLPNGNLTGAALEFAQGPFYLGAGFATVQRLPTGNDKEYAVGAGVKLGPVEIKGNWLVADQEGPNNRFMEYNVGAAMEFGPGKVFVNFQRDTLDTPGKPAGTVYAIAYSYALSKRTNLYTTLAALRNSSNARFELNSAQTTITPPPTVLGGTPKVFNVGVRHTF